MPGTAASDLARLTRQNTETRQLAATHSDAAGYRLAPRLEIKAQAGKKTGKQVRERASFAPESVLTRNNTNNTGINGSSIQVNLR
jgi:hypothetical protein